ncbi:MAG: hypothetical protein GYA23_05065 [Methanomicrobiales archaeon]|nr:hypothetical protein [Methanomicrobiales archaeon]
MNEPHPVRWKSMIGLGILSVLIGLFMLFLSSVATQLIIALSGFAIILLAAVFLVEGLCIEADGWPRWVVLGLGLLGILLGLISIIAPSLLMVSVGILTGLFLLLYGVGELAIGIGVIFAETMVRMIFIMLGIFSCVLGIFFMLNPALGLEIFILLFGMYLLVLGLMRIAHGINEREAEQNAPVKRL